MNACTSEYTGDGMGHLNTSVVRRRAMAARYLVEPDSEQP